jgi:hypothetical protein
MAGGAGDDTYFVDDAGDTVTEVADAGTDTVKSTFSYALGANLENLTLLGSANLNGTGNALSNVITGNSGNNVLDGGGGIDTASYAAAGAGVAVSLAVAGPQATGGAGTDTLISIENLTGSTLNDTLTGDGGSNVLSGGAGNDTLDGGGGIDTASYADAATAVTVNLSTIVAQNTVGAGSDTLTGIENLTGSAFNDTLTGNAGNNVLSGGAGDDVFMPSAGSDVLLGGSGFDTAMFGQPRINYQLQNLPGLTLVSGNDGMSVVGGVEKLQFSNGITQSLQVGAVGLTSDWSIVEAMISGTGRTELLWKNVDGRVGTWALSGSDITSEALVGSATTDWSISQIGDFNGDGKGDLLWVNTASQVALWLMDEGAFMGGFLVGSTPPGWTMVDAGDFDGDAKSDILWRNPTTNQIAIWSMDGPVFKQGYLVGSTPNGWSLQGAADFNGDGKSDLLWRHANGDVAIWTMNGPVFTGGFLVGTTGNDWSIVGAADFSGDGKGDILFRNVNGQVKVWTLNGPTFTGEFLVGGGATLSSIAGAAGLHPRRPRGHSGARRGRSAGVVGAEWRERGSDTDHAGASG